MFSSKPSQPNAIAIDEDGSDFSYFSVVDFGSASTKMYMLIDTGSANTWVMGSSCNSTACQLHNTFGPQDSKTLSTTSETWQLAYGTGEVEGVLAKDTVTFANYSLSLEFGLASNASSDFSNYPMDGILGLGPSSSNELNTSTVMQTLDKQAKLVNNVIGIHLQRAVDNTKDGELTIGGVDHTKFSGQLSYTKINSADSWQLPVGDVIVGGTHCNFTGKSAILDTGTSYILMPPPDAQTLHSLIPGAVAVGEQYTLPCGSTTIVQVTFSGVSYAISPKDYVGTSAGSVCNSNIIGHQAFGPNQWILGDTFLKNVYTAFDFDKNRIGLGVASSSPSAAASSSTAQSSATAMPTTMSTKHSTVSSTSTVSHSSTSTSSAPATTSTSSSADPFGSSSGSGSSAGIRLGMSVEYVAAAAIVVGLVL